MATDAGRRTCASTRFGRAVSILTRRPMFRTQILTSGSNSSEAFFVVQRTRAVRHMPGVSSHHGRPNRLGRPRPNRRAQAIASPPCCWRRPAWGAVAAQHIRRQAYGHMCQGGAMAGIAVDGLPPARTPWPALLARSALWQTSVVRREKRATAQRIPRLAMPAAM